MLNISHQDKKETEYFYMAKVIISIMFYQDE